MKPSEFFYEMLNIIPLMRLQQDKSSNHCVDYSVMASVILSKLYRDYRDVSLQYAKEQAQDIRADRRFPYAVRDYLGKNGYAPIYPNQLKKFLDATGGYDLDLGNCKVRLRTLVPRERNLERYKQYLRGHQVPILSMSYKKKRNDGFYGSTNPLQWVSKHNVCLVDTKDNQGGIVFDTNYNSEDWTIPYPNGCAYIAPEILSKKGNALFQGIWRAYTPSFRRLNK